METKCKNCGASDYSPYKHNVKKCNYCGTQYEVKQQDNIIEHRVLSMDIPPKMTTYYSKGWVAYDK